MRIEHGRGVLHFVLGQVLRNVWGPVNSAQHHRWGPSLRGIRVGDVPGGASHAVHCPTLAFLRSLGPDVVVYVVCRVSVSRGVGDLLLLDADCLEDLIDASLECCHVVGVVDGLLSYIVEGRDRPQSSVSRSGRVGPELACGGRRR